MIKKDKTKISDHFQRWEFACQCNDPQCFETAADIVTVTVLEACVSHFEAKLGKRLAIHINSGNRCFYWNKHEGGADASRHLYGYAVDFRIDGVHADEVADWLEETYPDKYGIGRYNGRTHFDPRPEKARWDNRNK